jgi:hypothetical protein
MKKNNTRFIIVDSQGFYFLQSSYDKIIFIITHTSPARKLWDSLHGKRYLACFSSNGLTSSQGIPCNTCKKINKCTEKFRLFFYKGIYRCCLELNPTSYENYLQYLDTLKKLNLSVNDIETRAFIINRGYWNEIFFEIFDSRA